MKRLVVLGTLVVILAAVLVALIAYVSGGRPPVLHGTYLQPPMPAADFTLTSAGGPVHKSDFKGRFVVLFFGYTFCPDVCPTTMTRLRQAMNLLGPDGKQVQVVMVSVDPERDTPDRMATYARGFNPSFIGVTGTPDEVAAVAADYGIYYAKSEGSAVTGYLIDHSAVVMVLDREGHTCLIWPYEITPEEMAEDLRSLIKTL